MTTRAGKLTAYRRTRDFTRTGEPEGGKRAEYQTSAKSGRTMEEIAEGKPAKRARNR